MNYNYNCYKVALLLISKFNFNPSLDISKELYLPAKEGNLSKFNFQTKVTIQDLSSQYSNAMEKTSKKHSYSK